MFRHVLIILFVLYMFVNERCACGRVGEKPVAAAVPLS